MKQTESTEGAAGSATRVIAEENPYLQRVASEEETSRTAGGNGSAETDDEEAAALAEIAAEKTKRKQRRHRRFALAFIAAVAVSKCCYGSSDLSATQYASRIRPSSESAASSTTSAECRHHNRAAITAPNKRSRKCSS